MNDKQLEKYNKIMAELQAIWEREAIELRCLHFQNKGIKSSQLGALVMYLIEKGVIKE